MGGTQCGEDGVWWVVVSVVRMVYGGGSQCGEDGVWGWWSVW